MNHMTDVSLRIRRWSECLSDPLWYQTLVPEFENILSLHDSDFDEYERQVELAYDFFERNLRRGTIALGTAGKNWDADRLPVDTIVIHHTSAPPGMTSERLSAIELIRLYAPAYLRERSVPDVEVMRQPIWSNHTRDGRQTFSPYHWLVRSNGTSEQLLYDHEIGWHAGEWDINRRSVAICLDGDFEDWYPSDMHLEGVARIIRRHYPEVKRSRIIGHCECRGDRSCPSRLFLPGMHGRGWKAALLEII